MQKSEFKEEQVDLFIKPRSRLLFVGDGMKKKYFDSIFCFYGAEYFSQRKAL